MPLATKSNLRLLVIGCTVLAVGSALYFRLTPGITPPVTIRVGVDHSPPFYLIGPNGSVKGLAVDVLNEAARRRNIHLIWMPLRDIPLEQALAGRIVQLWPLVGATPERRQRFYLSNPWFESDYVLASLRDRPIRTPADAAGLVVAHSHLKFTTLIADQYLSRSTRLIRPFQADSIAALCQGEAAAALVERRALDAILLARPPGCETANFHISAIAGATAPLSIAAVPEMRAAANALRDEITNLTKDGFLSGRLDEWSPFSAEGIRSVWAEREADRRSRIYRYSLFVILLLAWVLGWLAYRAWRLKQAAERAETGRREAQRRFTAFMDHSPAIAFMKDATGRLLYANKAWSSLFGLTPSESYGKSDSELWPADLAKRLRTSDEALLREDKPRQMVESVKSPAASSRDVLIVNFPFASEDGQRYVGGTGIDITEREEAIRALAASEARYRELFDRNPLPACVYDRKTLEFLAVNDSAVGRYGWTREEFHGMKLPHIVAPGETASTVWEGAWHHQTKDGLILSVEVTGYELEYEHREARLIIVRDVTEQERMLERLRMSEERWQLALRGAGDALWDWDIVSGRVFRSARWHLMLGYEEAIIGDSREALLPFIHPDDVHSIQTAVEAHLNHGAPAFVAEYRLRHKDGTWRWVMDRGQAVWDERGRPVRMAGAQSDITERRIAEDLLANQARTDALTGLYNRRMFEHLFAQEFAAAAANNGALSVCICDVDRFKSVNDTYGHAAGDRMLTAFGSMLRRNMRAPDLLARIGGDEFIIAMPGVAVEEACTLVEIIRRQLSDEIFVASDKVFHVTCSFGIAEFHSGHIQPDDLIAEADRFLYMAKGGGRNKTYAA
ncbi:MAG: diguanylate cyclase [Terriglobia bacterium]